MRKMKKRNTAIRRIVKCIETEYTTEGEFLLWETSVPKIQKGSDASVKTFKYTLNWLQKLELLKTHTYSRYTKTYVVGVSFPNFNRVWTPYLTATSYLYKLPAEPKYKTTKFRYHSISYQMYLALFRSGVSVYLGEDLKGPEYPTMMPILLEILRTMKVEQLKLLSLLKTNPNISLNLNDLRSYSFSIDPKISASLEYLVGTKGLLGFLGSPKNNNLINNRLRSIISFNTKIRNVVVIYIKNSKNSNNYWWGFISPLIKDSLTGSESTLCTNSRKTKTFQPTVLIGNQQVLDAYWNARKCVFGVHRTLKTAEGFTRYSMELPESYLKGIDFVQETVKEVSAYPIPFRTLFMALLANYSYWHRERVPPRNWFGSDQFSDWVMTFVAAYDEIEQFKHGAKQIGKRKIIEGEQAQFDVMKKVFLKMFRRQFGRGVLDVFGPHLDFYVDWCLFRAVENFQIAKTYFEHRAGINASVLAYVLAQVKYLRYRANVVPVCLSEIYGSAARLRMEHWIRENEPEAIISPKRKAQLNEFFAQQEMKAVSE